MKIGYFVQGSVDDAFVRGLVKRWCPVAQLEEGRYRGSTGDSLKREIKSTLTVLRDYKRCDAIIVLTDADVDRWQDVKRREWEKVPADYHHLVVFGVTDRNIECWLAIDRNALAKELQCAPDDIPKDDPSEFVQRKFGFGCREISFEEAKQRVSDFVAGVTLKFWIDNSDSFEDFYKDARALSTQTNCSIPNELESKE